MELSGSVVEWVMALVTVLSVLVAAVAVYLSHKAAKQSDRRAQEALGESRQANIIASQARAAASVSARAAEAAASAADEGNEITRQSLRLAQAQTEEIHQVRWSIGWSRPAREVEDRQPDWLPHLYVGNRGPDIAYEVRALFMIGEDWIGMVELGDISPGNAESFFPNESEDGLWQLVSYASTYEGPAPKREKRPFDGHAWKGSVDPHWLYAQLRAEHHEILVRWLSAAGSPHQLTCEFAPLELTEFDTDSFMTKPIAQR